MTSKKNKDRDLAPPVVLTSKILEKGWANLLEQNVPPEAGPELVKTFKRFYFVGAKTVLDALLYTDMLDENFDGPSKQDINRVDALAHEINAFIREVAAGRQ